MFPDEAHKKEPEDAAISGDIFNAHEDTDQSRCQGNRNTQSMRELEAKDSAV